MTGVIDLADSHVVIARNSTPEQRFAITVERSFAI